jgi:hypothetical protein
LGENSASEDTKDDGEEPHFDVEGKWKSAQQMDESILLRSERRLVADGIAGLFVIPM